MPNFTRLALTISFSLFFVSKCDAQQYISDPGQVGRGFGTHILSTEEWLFIPSLSEDTSVERSGVVYIYGKDQSNQWVLRQTLVSPEPQINGQFGSDLEFISNRLVVSSGNHTENASAEGIIFTFKLDGERWVLDEFIYSIPRLINTWFGRTMVRSGKFLAVSTSGQQALEFIHLSSDESLNRSDNSLTVPMNIIVETNESMGHLATCGPSQKAMCQSIVFYDIENKYTGNHGKIGSFHLSGSNQNISQIQFLDSKAFIGVDDLEERTSTLIIYDYENGQIIDNLNENVEGDLLPGFKPGSTFRILENQLFIVNASQENFNRSLGRIAVYDIHNDGVHYKGQIVNPIPNSTSNFGYTLSKSANQLFVADINPVGSKIFLVDLDEITNSPFDIQRVNTTGWRKSRDINLSIIQPEDDFVYITGGSGVIRLEGSEGRLIEKPMIESDKPPDQFLSIQDLGDQLLIGGILSLNLFDKNSFEFNDLALPNQNSWAKSNFVFEDSLLNIRALYRSAIGDLWLGSNQHLYIYPDSNLEEGMEFAEFNETVSQYDERYISAIQEDLTGRILVLVKDLVNPGGAIYRITPGPKTIERFPLSEEWGLLGPLHVDKSGLLWLDLFNPIDLNDYKDGVSIGSSDSKYSEPWAITQDNRGATWMASSKGLFFRSSPLSEVIAIPEFLGLHLTDIIESSDGKMVVASIRDIYTIEYNLTNERLKPETYLITRIEGTTTSGQHLSFKHENRSQIILPSNLNGLSVSFGNKSVGLNLPLEYLLENFENQWTEAKSQTISFPRLPSDEYTFRLRPLRQRDSNGISIVFHVQAVWYLRFWAKVLWALLLLGMTYSAYRLRILGFKKKQATLERIVESRTKDLQSEKEKTEKQAYALQQLDRAKNRFFTNITHEFRTPLTSIVAPLKKRLSSDLGTNSQNNYEDRLILRNAQSLLEMVTQILDLSKMESGQMGIDLVPVDLEELVANQTEYQLPFANSNKIELQFEADLIYNVCLLDQDKISTAIRNLISNAIKASRPGDKVLVKVWTENDVARISVRDEGTGIRAENLDKVFERFKQLDGGKGAQGGTGIGLSLTKEIAELLGGQLSVRSQFGIGSEFILSIPFQKSDLRPISSSRSAYGIPEPIEIGTSSPVDGKSVLIIEDNEDLRGILKRHLCKRYKISEAPNGRAALKIIQAHTPDLILCDVMMPEMDGFEFIQKLYDSKNNQSIPVIFVTARVTEEDIKKGLELGAVSYLTKPFDLDIVEVQLASVLRIIPQQQQRTLLVKSQEISFEDSLSVLMKNAIAVIEANISNKQFSIEILGDELGLSRRQLERRIRKDSNLTPADLIRQIRLERAYLLLSENKYSIDQVSTKVGYSSRSHFSRLFKKAFGFSPSHFAQKA